MDVSFSHLLFCFVIKFLSLYIMFKVYKCTGILFLKRPTLFPCFHGMPRSTRGDSNLYLLPRCPVENPALLQAGERTFDHPAT
jgi:hypothetical protein